jgi:hypothetical protein
MSLLASYTVFLPNIHPLVYSCPPIDTSLCSRPLTSCLTRLRSYTTDNT